MAAWTKLEPIGHRVAIAGQVVDACIGQAIGGAEVRITGAPPDFVSQLVTRARLRPLSQEAPPDVKKAWQQLDDPGITSAERMKAAQDVLDYLQAARCGHIDRPDQTRTTADGRFYFMDLPDIKLPNVTYELTVWLPKAGTRYEENCRVAVPVARDDKGNILTLRVADISLRPTTLQGRIVDSNDKPVPLAEIRMKGSGERTFSDTYEDLENPQKSTKGCYRLIGLEAGTRQVRVSAQGYKTADRILDPPLARGEPTKLDVTLEKVNHA